MEFAQHLEALSVESRAFSIAAHAAELSTPVRRAPTGSSRIWSATSVASTGGPRRSSKSGPGSAFGERIRGRGPTSSSNGSIPARLRSAETLERCGPGVSMWTWGPGGTSTWWARRQAHETAVHRWDAQTASGASQPIDGPSAADGLDEFLENFMAMLGFSEGVDVGGTGETIHLHCTDVDGEWLLRLEPDAVHVDRVHAKGDVAARGTASDLQLFACGRIGADRLEVFGDAALLARFRELARF